MKKDNSTGKDIDFYDKGQVIFDRIPGEKMIIKSAPITWHVDRLMCDCGGEFKHTINISYAEKPFGHVCDKCSALEATEYVYPRTVWEEQS